MAVRSAARRGSVTFLSLSVFASLFFFGRPTSPVEYDESSCHLQLKNPTPSWYKVMVGVGTACTNDCPSILSIFAFIRPDLGCQMDA